MLADAHIHLVDLEGRDPGFAARLASSDIALCAASHDAPEWARSQAILGGMARLRREARAAGGDPEGGAKGGAEAAPLLSSFGIHPQWAVWNNAELLAALAAEGRIAAIGEAGFDFFGDRPERIRNGENEGIQKAVFEYQLGLAERHCLPLLLHLRRATDLLFAYSRRLATLPAVILHSYSGTAREGGDLLARGVNAYFSFGATVLNGHKKAIEACSVLPADRLLSETDAPWQPPRGQPFCRFESIGQVVAGMAAIRGVEPRLLEERIADNFRAAFSRRPVRDTIKA